MPQGVHDHPDLVHAQSEHFGDVVAYFVRQLRRRPDVERPGARIHVGQYAAAFDRVRDTAMLEQRLAKDVSRRGELLVAVAVGNGNACEQVRWNVAARQRRVRGDRHTGVHQRSQHVVVHRDTIDGIFGEIARRRDHHRQGLSHIANFTRCQHERHRIGGQLAFGKRHGKAQPHHRLQQIIGRVDGDDAPHGARFIGVDRTNQRVRVRTAHERDMQRVGKLDIVDEPSGAAEQRRVFAAPQAVTNQPYAWRVQGAAFAFISAAAASAAATIF